MPTKFIGTEMFNLSKFKHCTKGFELHYGGA